jgi:hypothetical protein
VPTRLELHDVDRDGLLDALVGSLWHGVPLVVRNLSLDPVRCRRGNVNDRVGPLADVLRVNGTPGSALERRLDLASDAPIEIAMSAPPALQPALARFALYAWLGVEPTTASVRRLPLGLGLAGLPMPLVPGGSPAPRIVWNNLGRPNRLGSATLPSAPAPSVVLSRPAGVGRRATFTLQGLIEDPAAPNARAAVTNAVIVTAH